MGPLFVWPGDSTGSYRAWGQTCWAWLVPAGTGGRFFCLQIVSPCYPSKEATVGLPSNSSISIQGHCWGQSLSGKQDSHGSVFSCASPDCTAEQRLTDEKGGVRCFSLSEVLQLAWVCICLPTHPLSAYWCYLHTRRAQGLSRSWAHCEAPSWQPQRGEAARTANSMIMMYQGAVNLCRNAKSLGKTEMKEHSVFQSITVLKPCTSLALSSYITLPTLASDILKLPASSWHKMCYCYFFIYETSELLEHHSSDF